MTATETASIRTAVGRNIQRDREIAMYGCTEADLRENIESSFTFKVSGPAMIAAGILSDAQEMINTEYGKVNDARAEDARQAINRAKWVLFEYIMDKDAR